MRDAGRKIGFLWGMVALCWAGGPVSSLWALEIRILGEATVPGEVVRLGDVASFEPANDARVRELKSVQIASAPISGTPLTLNNRFLLYRIGSAVSGMRDVQLKLPETLVVHRQARVIGVAELEQIFRDHVLENAPWEPERLTFEKIVAPGVITLPQGALRWEVRKKRGEEYVGDVSVTVSFFVDGKPLRKVPITGRVSVDRDLLKTTRKIAAGEILNRNDVVLVQERQMHFKGQALSRLSEVLGKRATRGIAVDQVLERQMVEDPPLVRKGDRVVIRAESRGLKITAVGKVLQDGRSGEEVRVINTGSGREILATVQGPGQVGVGF